MPEIPYTNPPATLYIHGPNVTTGLDGSVTLLDPPVKLLAQIDLGVDDNGNVAFAPSTYDPLIGTIDNAPAAGVVIPPVAAFDGVKPVDPSQPALTFPPPPGYPPFALYGLPTNQLRPPGSGVYAPTQGAILKPSPIYLLDCS